MVTACLAVGWRQQGRQVAALKAVASGVPVGEVAQDAVCIATAAGHSPLCFAAFAEPLSPHLAAERAGASISPGALLDWIRGNARELTLIEGSGGWEVPLSPEFRVSDLAVALQADVVVVARNRLGVLNHTLLTVQAVRSRGLTVLGIALSPPEVSDLSTPLNELELQRFLPEVPICAVPVLDLADVPGCGQAAERLVCAFDRYSS